MKVKLNCAALALSILSVCSVWAQNIEKYIHTSPYTASNNVVYSDGYIYCEVNNCDFFNGWCNTSKILKLDLNLNPVDSLDLGDHLAGNPLMTFLTVLDNGKLALTLLRAIDTTANCFQYEHWLMIMDSDFMSIDSSQIIIDSTFQKVWIQSVRQFDSTLVISGLFAPDCFDTSWYGLALLLDLNGNQIKYELVDKSPFQPYEYRGIFLSDLIKYRNRYIGLNGSFFSDKQMIFFNENLEYDSVSTLARHVIMENGYNQFLLFDNNPPKVYTMGEVPKPRVAPYWPPAPGTEPYYKQLSLITLDTNMQYERIDTFSHAYDRKFDHGAFVPKIPFGTISYFNNPDSTVLMGTDVWTSYSNYGWKPSSNTYIHSINAHTGAVNWSKVYNNGYAHMGHKVVALPGNRTLLMFNEYNWDKYPYENLSVHLMIIDGEGNPIGIPENEKLPAQKPVVFPNPASGQVHIKDLDWTHPGGFTYRIADMNGRNIAEGKLGENTPVTLEGISSGLYIISIVNQHGVGWAEKLVVE